MLAQHQNDLEGLWDEDGFVFKARMGIFATDRVDQLLSTLRSITADDEEELPRRFVSLLWYMPLVLTWQRDRMGPAHIEALDEVIVAVTNEVERILGVP